MRLQYQMPPQLTVSDSILLADAWTTSQFPSGAESGPSIWLPDSPFAHRWAGMPREPLNAQPPAATLPDPRALVDSRWFHSVPAVLVRAVCREEPACDAEQSHRKNRKQKSSPVTFTLPPKRTCARNSTTERQIQSGNFWRRADKKELFCYPL